MSDEKQTTPQAAPPEQEQAQEQSKSEPSRPSHIAYTVRQGNEGQSYFNRVGSAFEHKDKQGFNLQLDSLPVDGRITLRTPRERLDAKRNNEVSARTDQDRGHGE
ncbi:MAG: hypothetical protein JKY46_08585 [Robiginitomaculum sp.]|nr:hypothetical protein [Robiginitomaculum sp.]